MLSVQRSPEAHPEVPADEDVLHGFKAGDLHIDVPPLYLDPAVIL